jgi:aminopeptidase YwaD
MLEMARVAAIRGQATNVCFMAFGGEELGLLGSMHYVTSLSQEEKQRIRAMINLDVVGAGNGWTLIGSQHLVETAQQGADSLGYRASPGNLPAGSSSDHASFIGAGIPAVFITISGSPPIHTPNDTADMIRPELLEQAADIGMYVLSQMTAHG